MGATLFCLSLILFFSVAFGADVHEQCQFGIDAAKQSGKASNDFGLKMFLNLAKPGENLVYSPVSISLALALVESGTSGETRNEIQRHLAPAGSNQLDSSKLYESLQRQLQIKGGDKVTLNIANGFFHAQELTVKPEFINRTEKCFETQVEKVQFKTNSEEARRHINQWVSEKTAQKIPELFKARSIDAQTVAVLASAIYLKAAWANRFEGTENLPFYKLGRDQAQTVSFMTHERKYLYSENDHIQFVDIPYDGASSLSMYILLPKQRGGLEALTVTTKEEIKALIDSATFKKVTLKVPKFTIRSTVSLKEVLQKLGINKIFTDQADFSRMSTQRLKVSSAVHEAYIKVNENGTEAAAATGLSIVPLMAEIPQTPVRFLADHPFAFTIVHKPTKAVIFAGIVVKIDQE